MLDTTEKKITYQRGLIIEAREKCDRCGMEDYVVARDTGEVCCPEDCDIHRTILRALRRISMLRSRDALDTLQKRMK